VLYYIIEKILQYIFIFINYYQYFFVFDCGPMHDLSRVKYKQNNNKIYKICKKKKVSMIQPNTTCHILLSPKQFKFKYFGCFYHAISLFAPPFSFTQQVYRDIIY